MTRSHSFIRPPEKGQSLVEFALVFPIFLALLIGLTFAAMFCYAYVTAQLAAREGTRSVLNDQTQNVNAVRATVCNYGISLMKDQMSVQVMPPDISAVNCNNNTTPVVPASAAWVSGNNIRIWVFYTIPLPAVTIPLVGSSSQVIFGPFQVKGSSVSTIE